MKVIERGVNKVILLGRLGGDFELKYFPDGKAFATNSLVTSKVITDDNGQTNEFTQWHNLAVKGKAAEILSQYAKKGNQLYVEGELKYTKYDDQQGVKRIKTEVIIKTFDFIGSRG